jgi:hypothetical protein
MGLPANQGPRIMYDTASIIEAVLSLRDMENRSDPSFVPATPTPTSKEPRSKDSSPPTQLQLPTRLRVHLTPTKKAPQAIRNAIGARKNRFKRDLVDNASHASSSNENSQHREETAPLVDSASHASSSNENSQHREKSAPPHVSGTSPHMSNNETTPV